MIDSSFSCTLDHVTASDKNKRVVPPFMDVHEKKVHFPSEDVCIVHLHLFSSHVKERRTPGDQFSYASMLLKISKRRKKKGEVKLKVAVVFIQKTIN